MHSNNITVTDARVLNALKSVGNIINNDDTKQYIEKEVDDAKLQTGTVKKYYQDINKVEVLLDTGKLVTCRVLRLFCNEFVTKYAPEGDYDWDADIQQGFIIPRSTIECVVMPVNRKNKNTDYFLMGYYNSKDVPEIVKAPNMGNVKLSYIGAADEYYIEFGIDGFKILTSKFKQETGFNNEYEDVNSDLATKEILEKDYYTKGEVDKLIGELREELTH